MSRNLLQSLDGVEQLGALSSLQAAGNRLSSLESLAALRACTSLSTLDLSENGLELDGPVEAAALLELLGSLSQLRVLYLSQGNPRCVAALSASAAAARPGGTYRKSLLVTLPELTYLDDRPVFDSERRCVDAWARGGAEAERAAEAAEAGARRAADAAGIEYQACLREERGIVAAPYSEGSGDEAEDPPELRRALELLAAFPPIEGEEEPLMLTSTREALLKAGRLDRLGSLEEAGREAWAVQAELVATSLEKEAAEEQTHIQVKEAEEPVTPAPSSWRDFSEAQAGPDSDDDEGDGYRSANEAFSPQRLVLTELD